MGAGFAGLETCGSVWACPVCGAKIAAHRGQELGRVLELAADQDMTLAMVTLTVRHHRGQSLKSVWDAVGSGWAAVTSGRPWQRMTEKHGVHGWARAVEVTHGSSGWHVHVHAVMLLDKAGLKNAAELGESMFGRWAVGLGKKGFTAVQDSGGMDVSISTGRTDGLGEYLAKMGLGAEKTVEGMALEATQGGVKKARGENRTPLQIAASFFETGDADDLEIWREWEKGSRGRRALTWSKGLRDWARLEAEKSDEEVAAEELGGEDLVLLPAETWRLVRKDSWRVLDLAEKGREHLIRWLDDEGLPWLEPPRTAIL